MLLTVQQGGGRLTAPNVTGVGLMGAELVRLAASGRVDIASDRIRVLDAAPTGDAEADTALASLAGQQRAPKATTWCRPAPPRDLRTLLLGAAGGRRGTYRAGADPARVHPGAP